MQLWWSKWIFLVRLPFGFYLILKLTSFRIFHLSVIAFVVLTWAAFRFRSPDCFSLGWPMRDDGEFFRSTFNMTQVFILLGVTCLNARYLFSLILKWILYQGRKGVQKTSGRTGKTNFVETRSFWNIFRSFDRLWTFYLLVLQVFVLNRRRDYVIMSLIVGLKIS